MPAKLSVPSVPSLTVALALSVVGCQPSSKKAADDKQEPSPKAQAQPMEATGASAELAMVAGSSPFVRDLHRICFQLTLSGASEEAEANRQMHAGVWLAKSIESQEGREFSAKLSQATLAGRIEILREEATKAGMSSCAIIDFWETALSPADPEDGVVESSGAAESTAE